MSALRRLLLRILALFRVRSLDRDLQDEIESHLAHARDEHLQRGLTAEEAGRRARQDLGGVVAARERHREARGLPTIESIRQDVSYALRGFVRDPGFTAVAVLVLALGIGANTAVFSVVNPMLLRPLPFRDPHQLTWISETGDGLSERTYRTVVFEELQRHNRSFSEMSGYFAFFGYMNYKLTGRGEAEGLVAVPVVRRFFEVLGVQPTHGRHFSSEELQPNGPKAAVLTHALWARRFGADPRIVGQSVTINGDPVRVVGILPADFDFGAVFTPGVKVDLFVPAHLSEMREWGNVLSIVGRLKPGRSIESARAEMATLLPQLSRVNAESGPLNARIVSLKDYVSGHMRRSLVVLWSAVGLVLLIVCANLSNLLLAHTSARGKEIAVRMALGAGRARVVRQFLTEGIVLALFGAAAGVPLAYALTWYLTRKAGLSLPLLHRVEVDGTALAFTALIAIVTGLTFGLVPALRVSRRDPQGVLKEQSRGSTDSPVQRVVRSTLVVSEVALACVLLVGAGLLMRSFIHILDVDLGFVPARATAVTVDPNRETSEQRGAPDASSRTSSALVSELVRRVSAVPGVQAAGVTDALPLDRNRTWGIGVPGQIYPHDQRPLAFVYITGPGYFSAMGIPLRSGRDFADSDMAKSQPVIIVNETLAKRLWPGRDPIGRPAITNNRLPETVIGVVADVRQSSLEEEPAMQMYLQYTQQGPGSLDLIVRTALPPEQLASSVRAALATLAPNLLTSRFRPMEDLVDRAVSPRRFLVAVLTGFSLLALALACLGIYGVVAYSVSQRVQEIGLRMALGATGADVRRHVLRGTLQLALAGIALGTLAAIPVARVIATLLFDTSPFDPATFATTALTLVFVAIVAGYVPALRASRIDPMSALRAD